MSLKLYHWSIQIYKRNILITGKLYFLIRQLPIVWESRNSMEARNARFAITLYICMRWEALEYICVKHTVQHENFQI